MLRPHRRVGSGRPRNRREAGSGQGKEDSHGCLEVAIGMESEIHPIRIRVLGADRQQILAKHVSEDSRRDMKKVSSKSEIRKGNR